METRTYYQIMDDESTWAGWKSLFRVAGVCIFISLAFILADMTLTFTGGDVGVGQMNAASWFGYIQNNWFLGLRNLGFWNVINSLLALPLYLGLFWLHRKVSPAYAALGLMLILVGAAVYVSNNRALSLLSLSSQYAAASTQAQKALLETAGTVILAQAEDFTPGTFMGFLLSSLASLIMMSVMLRGKVFRTWVAVIGLVGTGSLLIFTISTTFVPAVYDLAMIFAMVGGLLMIAWNFAMAFRMLRMSTGASIQAEELPVNLARTEGRILFK